MNTDVVQERKSSVLEVARKAYQEKNFNEIINLSREYPEQFKDNIVGLHLLGTAYANTGDYDNAERVFKQELTIDKDQTDAYYNLGLIYDQQNRIPEAIESFTRALELKPNDLQVLNDLGVVYYKSGDKERAGNLFKRALKSNPSFKDAFLNTFELLWNEGKYSTALEHAYEYLNKLSCQNNGVKLEKNPLDKRERVLQPPSNDDDAPDYDMPAILAPNIISAESRKRTNSKVEDLFNKHIPVKLLGKKTGMNIAVVGDINIAGQVTGLFRMINERTIHRARCIILLDDYLQYDHDIVLSKRNEEEWKEAAQIIDNADFFHIGRFPKQLELFQLYRYIRPDNTIVQYFGTELRENASGIYNWHVKNKITGIGAWDYTMIQNSPFFYHVNMMVDSSKIKPAPKPEGTIRIVHPTTSREFKRTEVFVNAVKDLQKEYDVEPVVIEGMDNKECLNLKSTAHMTFDQISVGIYGVSAIESMAAGQVVFGGISNFGASVYPDNPVVWITPENTKERIRYYLENRDKITERGQLGKAWVKQYHDPQKILKQYMYLYDFVRYGHRFMLSPDEQMLG